MVFRGRTVVILSPQPWNYLNISKHHYARALAFSNNVYFISPPKFGLWYSYRSFLAENQLKVIDYTIPIPQITKFKFNVLYRFLARYFLIKSIKSEFSQADFCIDFGWYQEFDSIKFFPAEYKIFFPVDNFSALHARTRDCNIVLTVSTKILSKFKQGECNFINHGLSREFAEIANNAMQSGEPWIPGAKINVGYAGNLFIPHIDIVGLKGLINSHPEVDFHFFGSQDFSIGNKNHESWDSFLRNAKNVKLYGRLTPRQLANEFKSMDMFLLCYLTDQNYQLENSHKIIEYLSTGKVVVSSLVSIYAGTDLLEMPDDNKQELLEAVFEKTLTNLAECNSIEKMNKRRAYALENTYECHLEQIAQIIQKDQPNRWN